MKKILFWVLFPFNLSVLVLLWLYQMTVSPLLGTRCRFYPSCSHYATLCFRYLPFPEALVRTILRVSRCQPWCEGGVDFPPGIPEKETRFPDEPASETRGKSPSAASGAEANHNKNRGNS